MTRSVIFALRDRVVQLEGDYERSHLPNVERTAEQARGLPADSLAGQGKLLILEAQVRNYLIDPTLEQLGWQLSSSGQMIPEAPVESTDGDGNRRYLDYFGRENDQESDVPLLILEAKKASVRLPGHPDMQPFERVGAITSALGQISTVTKTREIGAEWMKWLKTLKDYVARTHSAYGTAPKCAAMTNGEWYLVFTDPHAVFINGTISSEDICIFDSLKAVYSRADEFYKKLSFSALSSKIPAQHPADFSKFVEANATADAVLCLELTMNYVQEIQPAMYGRVYIRVEVAPNAWMVFQIEDSPKLDTFPPKESMFFESAAALREKADRLVGHLEQHARINLISAAQYKEKVRDDDAESILGDSTLCVTRTPGIYHLVLGNSGFYANESSEYDGRAYHAFGPSRQIGFASTPAPVTGPSRSPPVYFYSGSPLHCAHRSVHSQREARCVILSFESHMCCKRCAFEPHCWPTGTSQLPCQTG